MARDAEDIFKDLGREGVFEDSETFPGNLSGRGDMVLNNLH